MLNRIIPLLILLAVVATTFFYGRRISNEDDDIDQVETAFAGFNSFIDKSARMAFLQLEPGNDSINIKSMVRYTVAPRFLGQSSFPCDTTLVLCPINFSDSAAHARISQKKILWNKRLGNYYFILTSNR